MPGGAIRYRKTRDIPLARILPLYRANGWSAAEKPAKLQKALKSSHSLVSAWEGSRLVGLGNAISDGHLVVYYSHLLVHPEYQGRGIGKQLMQMLMAKYKDFHQQILVADGRAIGFYRKLGFQRADKNAAPMDLRGQRPLNTDALRQWLAHRCAEHIASLGVQAHCQFNTGQPVLGADFSRFHYVGKAVRFLRIDNPVTILEVFL